MALAERLMNARFGDDLVDHYTYVIAGDGCLMEGISHEAISLAGHLKLGRLIVLFDDNEISIDGATSLSCSDDQLARFEASGWSAGRIDGHDPEAIAAAIEQAREQRPAVADRLPHRDRLRRAEPAGHAKRRMARRSAPRRSRRPAQALDWPHRALRDSGSHPRGLAQGRRARRMPPAAAGIERTRRSTPARARRSTMPSNRQPACGYAEAMARLPRAASSAERPKIATRKASEMVLDASSPKRCRLLGGSADLTHSNLTARQGHRAGAARRLRRQLHPLRRPRARHGGGDERHRAAWRLHPLWRHVPRLRRLRRPAIRLAALMGIRVIYVMTHDSIGLGEDGPTHQPVEHLASLRAIPNLLVFRPGDAVETAEAWDCALRAQTQPVGAVPVAAGDADVSRRRRRAQPGRARRLCRASSRRAAATSR